MSILTAIFQAIGQAICFIFPLSESGHTAIFNDFSARYSGVHPELTGLIHIGIAIGVIAAFHKTFIRLVYEFFAIWKDVFQKKFSLSQIRGRRKFMLLTFIPYLFMFFYAIPAGDKGNIYETLHSLSYDGNLLAEGICFIISAILIFASSFILAKNEKGKPLGVLPGVVLGALIFFTIPFAGLSLSAVIISVAVMMGVNRNVAIKYFASISVPALIVSAIVQIVRCTVYVNIFTGVIAVVVAGACAFLVSVLLMSIVKNNAFKYFSYYNFAIGFIITIVGIVEILVK